MNYREAFKCIVNERGVECFRDSFMVYSYLSDCVGNSIENQMLVKAFYFLNKKKNIYHLLNGLNFTEAMNSVKDLIKKPSAQFTAVQLFESVEPLLSILYKDEYTLSKNPLFIACTEKAVLIHGKRTKGDIVNKSLDISKPRVIQTCHGENAILSKEGYVKDSQSFNASESKKEKKRRTLSKISSVLINAFCSRVAITYSNDNNISVLNDNGRNVTNQVSVIQKDKKILINLYSVSTGYTIKLPPYQYDKLEVHSSGEILRIEGKDNNCFYAERVELLCNNVFVYLFLKSSSLMCYQSKGKLNVFGDIADIIIDSNKADIKCRITGKCDNCVVKTTDGDVDIAFFNGEVKPRINHLFKVVKCVKGKYRIGKRNVMLTLSTNNGKIKVM